LLVAFGLPLNDVNEPDPGALGIHGAGVPSAVSSAGRCEAVNKRRNPTSQFDEQAQASGGGGSGCSVGGQGQGQFGWVLALLLMGSQRRQRH
jgi:hypothetical protein